MPEGHTLHRIARDMAPLVGRRVAATSPQGRFAEGANAIDGRCVSSVDAYGKHLLVDFGDLHLHVHLGLAGSVFGSDARSEPRPGIRLRLAIRRSRLAWDVVAPNRCELYDDAQRAALLGRLGVDPLRDDDPTAALMRIGSSAKPIGELLLDQRIIAGIGNVYRAEALHRCRIHPDRPGSSLTLRQLRGLWDVTVALMRRGVEEGRIVTIDTPDGVDRTTIDPTEGRYVYKQDACRSCSAPVRSWNLANRVAYACERCQRRPRARPS